MVKASHGVPQMCSSLQTASGPGPALHVRGLSSVRRQQQANTGETQTLCCVPQAREATVLHPPLGPASPQPTTAMLSIKEQNFGTSLNGVGFPEAQRIPTRGFQRSLSVVIAPEGYSCGIQILLESETFSCRRMVEMSFWSRTDPLCLS